MKGGEGDKWKIPKYNNIVNDPIIADSVADPITIGVVNTTTGLNSNDVVPDTSFSITKESLSYFFDEYLNNELEWNWTNPVTATSELEPVSYTHLRAHET